MTFYTVYYPFLTEAVKFNMDFILQYRIYFCAVSTTTKEIHVSWK